MIRKIWYVLIILLAAVFTDCKAQMYLPLTIPITISEVLDLNVSPTTTLSFDFTTTSDIESGLPKLAAHSLTFNSNKDWYITIKAISLNFSGGDSNYPMPVSMLKYKLSTGTYQPLSASPQTLSGTSSAKNLRGTGTIVVDFLMDPGYVSYPAQDYSVTITYTILNL